MIKILLMTAVWKRPELTAMMVRGLNFPDYANVRPFFILSEEDPYFLANHAIVKNYDYLVYPNEPLGRKKNVGLRFARQWDWDYLMELGSDDLYTPLVWKYYMKPFAERWPVFGFNQIYYYNITDGSAVWMENYALDHEGEPMPFGALRCIRRDLIDGVDELWRDKWFCSMDGCSYQVIKDKGYRAEVIDVGRDPVICDIKSGVNLTSWPEIEQMKATKIDGRWVAGQFGIEDRSGSVKLIDVDMFHKEVCKLSQRVPGRDAFNSVNERYRDIYGEPRYKNYDSYKSVMSRRYGKV